MCRFLLAVLFAAPSAFAAIPEIIRVEGASGFDLGGQPTIFATFLPACAQTDGVSACALVPASEMNPVSLVFKEDVSQVRLALANGLILPSNKNVSYKRVDFALRDVCQLLQGSNCSSLSSSKTIALRAFNDANNNWVWDSFEEAIGLQVRILNPDEFGYAFYGQPNEDGIGGFTAFPGESSVYLTDIQAAVTFPTLTYGSKVVKVRVYVSDREIIYANPKEAFKTVDLDLTPDGLSLADNRILGLQNGTVYTFRLAMIDEAGNVVQNFPAEGADATCDDPSSSVRLTCPWAAMPEAVIGR